MTNEELEKQVTKILMEVRNTAILLERFDVNNYPKANSYVEQIINLIKSSLPELAKDAGYVKP